MPESISGCRQFEGEDLSKYQFIIAEALFGKGLAVSKATFRLEGLIRSY